MPVQELKVHSLPGARYLTNVMFCFEQSMLTVILFFATAPSSPTNVSAISLSSDTILVEWNEPLEPNGIVRYYVITVYESDYSLARNRTQENSTSADRSRTIGRLQPFTQYSVIVQAVTVEPGSESEVAVVRTNESGRLGKMKI